MPEIQNTRVTPRKRLSRIPQLMVRKHAGNPKHHGDAILERLLATRHALGQGPSSKEDSFAFFPFFPFSSSSIFPFQLQGGSEPSTIHCPTKTVVEGCEAVWDARLCTCKCTELLQAEFARASEKLRRHPTSVGAIPPKELCKCVTTTGILSKGRVAATYHVPSAEDLVSSCDLNIHS